MTDLSPAAQAVLTAFAQASDGEYIDGEWQQDDVGQLAAALRAVADQAAPELPHSELDDPEILKGIWGERRACRAELLAIATELGALGSESIRASKKLLA